METFKALSAPYTENFFESLVEHGLLNPWFTGLEKISIDGVTPGHKWIEMKKTFIQADQLLEDSFKLAWNVYESGFRPNYIVGVWRGGAPIGIAVQEFLEVLGVSSGA